MSKITKTSLIGYILKNQRSFIVVDIHKPSPILDYTFLQSNLQQLPNYLKPNLSSMDFTNSTIRNIGFYLDEVERLKKKLIDVQNQEIKPSVIRDEEIGHLSELFRNVKKSINEQAQICLSGISENYNNIQQLSFLASSFNILEMPLWNKLIMSSSSHYKQMPIQNRDLLIESIKNYVNKYSLSGSYKFRADKFIMKQTHLQDIMDFDFFLQFTQQKHIFNDQQIETVDFSTCFNLFKNRIEIIKKFSKSTNINFYELRAQYKSLLSQIRQNLDFMQINDLLTVYNFYVKISACGEAFMEEVQQMIFKRLQYDNSQNDVYRQNIYKQILEAWKISARYNKKIWDKFIQPFLNKNLDKLPTESQIKPHVVSMWNNIAYSIICSGITNTNLPQRIISILGLPEYQNNQTYKVTTQYLKIKTLQKQDKNLEHELKLLLNESQNKNTASSEEKTQAIQYNPIEHFWENIIKGVLPQECIHKSKYISVFEVDILVEYRGKYFAFEVQGSHYRFGKNQSGKKKIKEEILKCYGVTTIAINCAETVPKLIMRLKFVPDGEKYIRSLLEKHYEESINNAQHRNVETLM